MLLLWNYIYILDNMSILDNMLAFLPLLAEHVELQAHTTWFSKKKARTGFLEAQ